MEVRPAGSVPQSADRPSALSNVGWRCAASLMCITAEVLATDEVAAHPDWASTVTL
jgi:hypothetical protein